MEKRINKFRGWLPRKPMKFDNDRLPDLEENESFTAPFSRSRIHQWVVEECFTPRDFLNLILHRQLVHFHSLFCTLASYMQIGAQCKTHFCTYICARIYKKPISQGRQTCSNQFVSLQFHHPQQRYIFQQRHQKSHRSPHPAAGQIWGGEN